MRPRIWQWIFSLLWILIPLGLEAAPSKPVITRLDTQFLDNNVNINIHWDSPNPVVSVKVLVGAEQKEVKVDEYDNKRNPRGYTGEATVVLNVQPRPGIDFINYVVYLEDDLRQKSEQKAGRAKIPTTAMAQTPGMPSVQVGVQVGVQPGTPPGMQQPGMPPGAHPGYPGAQSGPPMGMPPGPPAGYQSGAQPGYSDPQYGPPMGPQSGFQVGASPGGAMGEQPSGPTGMINLTPNRGGVADSILGLIGQMDVPPYFSDIKVNLYQGNNVTISGKVIDDKGLREISFRIFDVAGNKVQEQTITNQGKVWQGTTNPFNLFPGKYRVIGQAVDSGGNSSKERTADFEITGQGQVMQTASPAPAMTPEQAQAFSATLSPSGPQSTSPDQQGATGQPGPGQQSVPGRPSY